jgi:hypothetical protein
VVAEKCIVTANKGSKDCWPDGRRVSVRRDWRLFPRRRQGSRKDWLGLLRQSRRRRRRRTQQKRATGTTEVTQKKWAGKGTLCRNMLRRKEWKDGMENKRRRSGVCLFTKSA